MTMQMILATAAAAALLRWIRADAGGRHQLVVASALYIIRFSVIVAIKKYVMCTSTTLSLCPTASMQGSRVYRHVTNLHACSCCTI